MLDCILLLFHHVGQVEADRANVDPSLGKVHLRHVVVVGVVQQRLERERERRVKRSSTYRIYCIYSRKYWRELNLVVEPKIAIGRILVGLNLAVRYGITIRIYASRKFLADFNLAVGIYTAKLPNLIPSRIFQLYGIHKIKYYVTCLTVTLS